MTPKEPTLVELLEEAAEDQRKSAVAFGVACYGAQHWLERAARLRAASQRLREEMERANVHPLVNSAAVALNYINNGPLNPKESDK